MNLRRVVKETMQTAPHECLAKVLGYVLLHSLPYTKTKRYFLINLGSLNDTHVNEILRILTASAPLQASCVC